MFRAFFIVVVSLFCLQGHSLTEQEWMACNYQMSQPFIDFFESGSDAEAGSDSLESYNDKVMELQLLIAPVRADFDELLPDMSSCEEAIIWMDTQMKKVGEEFF